MAFDPSVISTIGEQPDIGASMAKAFTLKDMMNENSLKQMKIREGEQNERDNATTREILKKYDLTKSDQASKAAVELQGKGLTAQGLNAIKANRDYESGKYAEQLDQLKVLSGVMDFQSSLIAPVYAQAQQMLGQGRTPVEVDAYIAGQLPKYIQDIQGNDSIPPEMKQAIIGHIGQQGGKISYAQLQQIMRDSEKGRAILKSQLDQAKGESEMRTREEGLKERERHDKAMEAKEGAKAAADKAPAGFQWNADHTRLEPIPGGPKDPQSSNMSGRQAVYFARVAAAGNEAATAIKNIVNLPTGASSGVLGVGATPGHSMLQSAQGALTNELATQEVQDYNTMLAGVRRNLATIETAGLAPGGSLTESMQSLELRAGDTGITKLRKLAEMRQIVEKGLEPNLSDPHIPQPQKQLIQKIIDQVKGAVPFTQDDVTRLQQGKNKKETLTDEMKQQGLAGGHPDDIQALLDKYK